MIDFDVYSLPDSPLGEHGPLPSMKGYDGDFSFGVHPTEDGGAELLIASSDEAWSETFHGERSMAYANAILRANAIAQAERMRHPFQD